MGYRTKLSMDHFSSSFLSYDTGITCYAKLEGSCSKAQKIASCLSLYVAPEGSGSSSRLSGDVARIGRGEPHSPRAEDPCSDLGFKVSVNLTGYSE